MFGLGFERVTLHGAVEQIMEEARTRTTGLIVTPNVDQVIRFERDPAMHRVYASARHVYADGMPLVWMSRLVDGAGLPERVAGADLLPAVCEAAAKHGSRVFFCGAAPGVAALAADRLGAAFPGLQVAGIACPPFGFEHDEALSAGLVSRINDSGADILFLGVGAPKQEKWGHRHLGSLAVGPVLCVGAAFAFAAGLVKRAPGFLQQSGFEWAWRLAQEPRRLWRRYLVDDARFAVIAAREVVAARRARRNAARSAQPD